MSQVTPARKTRVRIGPRSAGILMTPEEFDDLPESRWLPGYRYEVIGGILVVSPPPVAAVRAANDELGLLLRSYETTHTQGSCLDATLPEQNLFTTPNRRRCDRAVWCGLGRHPDEREDVPAIVVDFPSRSKLGSERDALARREEHRRAGVREYWVFDRFQRRFTAHCFRSDRSEEIIVAEGGTYHTDLLPGFVLPVSRILAQADAWPTKKRRGPRAGDSQ